MGNAASFIGGGIRGCHDSTEGKVIAIDGKTVCWSYNKLKYHLVIHLYG